MRSEPAVFTIPPHASFLDALAAGVLSRHGADPLALAELRVLLPTRRACRAFEQALLRAAGGRPLLLPRAEPLGDIDEDELALDAVASEGAADLSPAISPLRRRLILARLVRAWWRRTHGRGLSVDQATRLADALAGFLDEAQTAAADFARLDGLVPADLAGHWQDTLAFLRIVTAEWPALLVLDGSLDPAEHRNRLLAARAEAWTTTPPPFPVIAAGSTGSIPATARLLGVVARLPRGAVVLPGLDLDLPDAAWDALDPAHPQYGLKHLVETLGIDRADIAAWPHAAPEGESDRARAGLVRAAFWPGASETPPNPVAADAVAGIERIDAATPEEEAGAIALVMRGTLEKPGMTCALVTPDRALARRVAAALGRWGLTIDDSAGTPLAETVPGVFLRLVAAIVLGRAAPVPLLALLKHPLCASGLALPECRRLARELELAVLRGPRPGAGFRGLRGALGRPTSPLKDFVRRIEGAVAPLARLLARGKHALDDLVRAHVAAAEALAASDGESGAARLWAGEAGGAAAGFVAELIEASAALGPVEGARWPALLDALLAGHPVRPRLGAHPRLAILGPLEARLQHVDVMVLGGLVEGTWPAEAAADPWMSRPMRAAFGLEAPERRIGLAAHDIAQALAAPHVVLTRAERVDGTPTVPSRWLTRLEYTTGGEAGPLSVERGRLSYWLDWQRRLLEPTADSASPLSWRPAPKPPVAARPRRLSVTRIEAWMRDPYAIYAQYILRLRALDPLDAPPTAADYGTHIHDALGAFLATCPAGPMPADAHERLLAEGRKRLDPVAVHPSVHAFWWPRFMRVADWFLAEEARRRGRVIQTFTEIAGSMKIAAPAGSFEVYARADRIDRMADGTLAIIDYKTGAPPSTAEVAAGYAPQLPLEAAIAEAVGFAAIGAGRVVELAYWQLSGGDPAGRIRAAGDDPATLTREALAGLARLVAAFDDPATAYEARPRPDAAPKYSDYEHLARLREWSVAADGDEAGGGE
ncbi:MAG: double-strand break repair protein AddB [Alphaproteobacteria bacterium]|nr:double-strand break repair protein AddB [Alphaproteobacteria bacterium]